MLHAGRPGDGAPLPAAHDGLGVNGACGGDNAAAVPLALRRRPPGALFFLELDNNAASAPFQPERSIAFAAADGAQRLHEVHAVRVVRPGGGGVPLLATCDDLAAATGDIVLATIEAT